MDKKKIRHRKSIRLKEFDYSNPGWYYITICTHKRKNLFCRINNGKIALNDFGKIVELEWLRTIELRNNIELDYYVIMPNHFHGILIINRRDTARCVPTDQNRKFGQMIPGSLPVIIRSFKSAVTKRINELRNNNNSPIWQRNYYEHIVRNEKDLFFIRKYIEQNPFKWELDEYYNQ